MRKQMLTSRASRVKTSIPLTTEDGVNGVITDISTAGILVELPEKKELGSVIDFSVEIKTRGGPLKLIGQGEVVRVEEDDGKFKVAAKAIAHSGKV